MLRGGNTKFVNFLGGYDLNDQPAQVKYTAVAALHYRNWLKSEAIGKEFADPSPNYDLGRKSAPMHQLDFYPDLSKESIYQDQNSVKAKAAHAMKAGWGYLSWGASKVKEKSDKSGLTDAMKNAANKVSTKAEESGFNDKMRGAAEWTSEKAKVAANYTYESGQSVVSSAKDGSLKEKTIENSKKASDYLSQVGSSLYGKV